tara:strand:- start:91 stop:237 length:147 start_codon:yes stop_codon:yes gene_type:complete
MLTLSLKQSHFEHCAQFLTITKTEIAELMFLVVFTNSRKKEKTIALYI